MKLLFILLRLFGLSLKPKRANFYDKNKQTNQYKDYSYQDKHLEWVENGNLAKRPLMNKEEFRLYQQLEKCLKLSQKSNIRLFSQVNMGEISEQASKAKSDYLAFKSINAKRLDFIFINSRGFPILAIEYQGSGHNLKNNDYKRDHIKKLACANMGIKYLEVIEGYEISSLKERVIDILNGLDT